MESLWRIRKVVFQPLFRFNGCLTSRPSSCDGLSARQCDAMRHVYIINAIEVIVYRPASATQVEEIKTVGVTVCNSVYNMRGASETVWIYSTARTCKWDPTHHHRQIDQRHSSWWNQCGSWYIPANPIRPNAIQVNNFKMNMKNLTMDLLVHWYYLLLQELRVGLVSNSDKTRLTWNTFGDSWIARITHLYTRQTAPVANPPVDYSVGNNPNLLVRFHSIEHDLSCKGVTYKTLFKSKKEFDPPILSWTRQYLRGSKSIRAMNQIHAAGKTSQERGLFHQWPPLPCHDWGSHHMWHMSRDRCLWTSLRQ